MSNMRRLSLGAVAMLAAGMAPAFASPLDRGPIADFLTLFRQSAIPKQLVVWRHPEYKPGTVVVSTRERRLYYVLSGNQAIEYGVGVGREGFTWSGVKTVSRKREWPDWRPPAPMLRRRPDLPRHMAGGMENPLGRAGALSRLKRLSNPWLERTRHDRRRGVVRLHSHDE